MRNVLLLTVLGFLWGVPKAAATPVWFKFKSAFITAHKALIKSVCPELRCITVQGSSVDAAAGSSLAAGAKAFLLGFFSVNLKRAADAATRATTAGSAVAVQEALECLILGKATLTTVATCSSNAAMSKGGSHEAQ